MDSSTPWVPSWNGDRLTPFDALREVQEDGLVPTPAKHRAWSEMTLERELSRIPEGREAIWNSVLELWRLKYVGYHAKDESASLWQQLTSAWLVRDYSTSDEWRC